MFQQEIIELRQRFNRTDMQGGYFVAEHFA